MMKSVERVKQSGDPVTFMLLNDFNLVVSETRLNYKPSTVNSRLTGTISDWTVPDDQKSQLQQKGI